MRVFDSGATRDTDTGKLDYAGFLSPIVLQRYAEYMNQHRVQANGELRGSDNWKRGIPRETYISSGFRHFMDWWLDHEGWESREGIEDAICGLMFNCMGYLHETLLEKMNAGENMFELPLFLTSRGEAGKENPPAETPV